MTDETTTPEDDAARTRAALDRLTDAMKQAAPRANELQEKGVGLRIGPLVLNDDETDAGRPAV